MHWTSVKNNDSNPGIESAPLAPHGNSAREHQQMRNRLGPKRCIGMSHVLDVSDVSAKSLSGHLNPQNSVSYELHHKPWSTWNKLKESQNGDSFEKIDPYYPY
jgi:uncharacterized membrane protein